jgi:hypothetical protein
MQRELHERNADDRIDEEIRADASREATLSLNVAAEK